MLKIISQPNIFAILLACFFGYNILFSQTPFVCKDQAFGMMSGSSEFVNLVISPTNSAITVSSINPNIGVNINSIGYRRTDNLIYGIDPLNHHLFQVDATGAVFDLGPLNLPGGLQYLAGDINPSGQFLYAIGSVNNLDQSLVKIDLESGNFNVQTVVLNGSTSIADIT